MRSLMTRMVIPATRSTASSPPHVGLAINVGYPTEWLEHYTRNNYFASDPAKRRLLAGLDFQRLCDSYSGLELHSEKKYVRHALEYGMTEGATIGCRRPRAGFLSFFAFRGRDVGRTVRDRIMLGHIAPYLHEAMSYVGRTALLQAESAQKAVLSNREEEVLRWAMDGKTNWEISMILNIGERTVKFHVQNAMRKLDASTRSQAVAIAIRQGLIP